jgi:NAD(P)-dependent dehydrogenase (short-subunit alcohol dehydrogenase family)
MGGLSMASSNPVLLVTGASRGIGAATAKMAAERGFNVAVNFLHNVKAANEVAAAIEASGQRAITIQGNMAREEEVAGVVDTTVRELGALTHLVYNSGITGASGRLEAVEPKVLREVFDLNVLGAFLCVRAAIPHMSIKHGQPGGAVVLLSSAAATIGSAGEYVWYAASKAAIDGMTIGLARELASDGIRVNAVAPGLIDTEIHPAGRLERLTPLIPIGRVGAVDEVAQTILFLLSDAASYMTGSVLRVAGGR